MKLVKCLGRENKRYLAMLLCECGSVTKQLKHRPPMDCGCGISRKTQRPEYSNWLCMISRVTNPNDVAYDRYGGAGITMDPSWNDFWVFLRDVGNKPTPKHTIDRIDNTRGYYKDNVRWATMMEQSKNKKRCHNWKPKYKDKYLTEWCKELGLSYKTFSVRLHRGWSIEKSLHTPVLPRRPRKSGHY